MKQVIVQAGPFAGEEAIIIGADVDLLGHSIFAEKNEMGFDYVKRLALEPVSTLTKVFIAKINGKDVALNQYEITGKGNK